MRAVAVTLLVALACGDDGAAPAADRSGPRAAVVRVAPAASGAITEGWVFLGRVRAQQSAELAAAVAGHVREVAVREGDRVETGATLVRLDDRSVRASRDAAAARARGTQSELVLAQKQLDRVAKLGYPTVSEAEKERFQLQVESLSARLASERAEARRLGVELSQHQVSAPFDGVVAARHVDPGAWVAVGQPVVTLVSLGDVEVLVDVPAEVARRLEVGDPAVLRGDGEAAAKVHGLVPALDATTGTMQLRLRADDPPSWLAPGLAVDVEVPMTTGGAGASAGVTVPRDALVRGPVGVKLFVVEGGAARPVDVEVLAQSDERALVTGDGLAAGDQVVVRGNDRLRPGQPVEIAGE